MPAVYLSIASVIHDTLANCNIIKYLQINIIWFYIIFMYV